LYGSADIKAKQHIVTSHFKHMKTLFCQLPVVTFSLTLMFNFFCVTKVRAQPQLPRDDKEEILAADTSSTLRLQNLNSGARADKNSKARLLAIDKNFDTYELPMDNMPCLVPDSPLNDRINSMPEFNTTGQSSNTIPNLFSIEEMIPKKASRAANIN
jgi:hypothetical protein